MRPWRHHARAHRARLANAVAVPLPAHMAELVLVRLPLVAVPVGGHSHTVDSGHSLVTVGVFGLGVAMADVAKCLFFRGCEEEDLNLHEFPHRNLNPHSKAVNH